MPWMVNARVTRVITVGWLRQNRAALLYLITYPVPDSLLCSSYLNDRWGVAKSSSSEGLLCPFSLKGVQVP